MFKKIFGKPDDEPSGLNVGRLTSAPAPVAPPSSEDSVEFRLPSRKPPPNLKDLELPETLAEEATHPRDVDVRFVLAQRPADPPAPAALPELTADQLELVARRVADQLATGIVGERLREAVTRIVSETSERLIREEIARIRGKANPE